MVPVVYIENIDFHPFPNFLSFFQCCVPELSQIREFVSRPPMGNVRLHCTMIRHTDDTNLISGTCFTLYLEYLGGLVPLLKGKRTSKIRPEFVIYDPQVDGNVFSFCCSQELSFFLSLPPKETRVCADFVFDFPTILKAHDF